MTDAQVIIDHAEEERKQRIIVAGSRLSADIADARDKYLEELEEAQRVFELRLTGIREEEPDGHRDNPD